MRRALKFVHTIWRGSITGAKCVGEAFKWLWEKRIFVSLLVALLMASSLSVILPMRYPSIPFLFVYLGIIAFSILLLIGVITIALDRIAETIGVSIKMMSVNKQTMSALYQALLKNNDLVERHIQTQNVAIGKLNETEQTINIATDKMVATAGDLIRTLQSR